jgi:hypothetical protein
MRGTLEAVMWALRSPALERRKPRDGEMKCGTQSADMSVIIVAIVALRVAFLVRVFLVETDKATGPSWPTEPRWFIRGSQAE